MSAKLQIGVLALVWGLIAGFQGAVTFFVDDRFQAYRGWEYAQIGARSSRAPFRPFAAWDAVSYGDLSHMAGAPQLRAYRRQRFTTDEYGYRNPVGTLDRTCEVVILGDSAAVGALANDGETLSGLIRTETPLGVYNDSGVNIAWFLGDRRFLDRPPKQVIVVSAERNLGNEEHFSTEVSEPFRPRVWTPSQVMMPAPFVRMGSLSGLLAALDDGRALRPAAEPVFKGLLFALGLYGLPPEISHRDRTSGTLYLTEAVDRHLDPEETMTEVDRAAEVLRWFNLECRRRGIELLVVVIPEKETVYSERLPALRGCDVSAALRRFRSELADAGVGQVDVLTLFADYRRRHPQAMLYYPDDTHLNPLGHRLVFGAVRDRLPTPRNGEPGASAAPRAHHVDQGDRVGGGTDR